MIGSAVDWTQVLGDLIAIIPAVIAAYFAYRIHGQVKTPSGKTLGAVAEYAHDVSIANNLLLSQHNGPTKPIDHETLEREAQTPPQVPAVPKPDRRHE